ncbi:MAG TPA: hypothetical protein VFV68_16230 [Agriterribacter sp.]|nr:hypothetical protein [Agriterribacter sp.]
MRIIIKLLLVALVLAHPGMEVDATAWLPKNDTVPSTRADYLRVSKSQNTTAIIMVSVGGAAFMVGVIGALTVDVSKVVSTFALEDNQKSNTGYVIAAVAGGILALASIPVFKSAHKNKEKAMLMPQVALKMENLKQPVFSGVSKASFPSITIKLRF